MICYVDWCKHCICGECTIGGPEIVEWKTTGEFCSGERVGFAACDSYEEREETE